MKSTIAALLCLTTLAPLPVVAQTSHPVSKVVKTVQKHPTATGVAAGIATHAALKRSAAAKKKLHQKLTWAERHPTLTGIAAGTATRLAIKKSTAPHQ